MRWECYDSSYRLRAERFRWLAPGAGLEADLVQKIVGAYRFKCLPDYEQGLMDNASLHAIGRFFPDMEMALICSINVHTESHAKTLPEAMKIYLKSMSGDASWVGADNAHCVAHPDLKAVLKPGLTSAPSFRHLVYSAVPSLVLAAVDTQRAQSVFAETVRSLEPYFSLPAGVAFSPKAWEDLRALVVKAWFAVCH